MYRVLIVDDEEYITDGLAEILEESSDAELDIYKSYSGFEALEFLANHRIDILISDINMPGMNGLQLMEAVRAKWTRCRIILLTGHDEFEYVYRAIQNENVGYILKTEGYDKVIDTVKKAVEALNKEVLMEELVNKAESQMILVSEIAKKEYLNAVIRGVDRLPQLRQQQFQKMGIELDNYLDLMLLIGRIDGLWSNMAFAEKAMQVYSAEMICAEYFPKNINIFYFSDNQDDLVWLIQPNKDSEATLRSSTETAWREILSNIQGNLELAQLSCTKTLGRSISFAFTEKPFHWEELPKKYDALKGLLKQGIGEEGSVLTEYSLQGKSEITIENSSILKDFANENNLNTLKNCLDMGEDQKYFSVLDVFAGELAKIKSMNSCIAQEAYFCVAIILLEYINKWGISNKISFKTGLYRLTRMEENTSWSEAADYLKELSHIIFEIHKEEKSDKANYLLGYIEKFIDENIGGDLSVVRIADYVHFSPSYLSRLFKQMKGISISDYVSEMRIKKAKTHLLNAELRVNEIAEKVGYLSANNFTRFFRKVTGVAPQEYRDSKLR